MDDPLLTRVEAAAYLKVSVRTIDRLRVPKYQVGRLIRIRKSDLDDYLSSGARFPAPSPKMLLVSPRTGSKRKDTDWLRSKLAELKRR